MTRITPLARFAPVYPTMVPLIGTAIPATVEISSYWMLHNSKKKPRSKNINDDWGSWGLCRVVQGSRSTVEFSHEIQSIERGGCISWIAGTQRRRADEGQFERPSSSEYGMTSWYEGKRGNGWWAATLGGFSSAESASYRRTALELRWTSFSIDTTGPIRRYWRWLDNGRIRAPTLGEAPSLLYFSSAPPWPYLR